MFAGLRTIIYGVDDIVKAKNWYSEALEFDPYFDEPYYVGFNVGGFELGLDPFATSITRGGTGVVAYWGVTDIDAALAKLIRIGAAEHNAVRNVGDGIKVASVLDPFGNVLGLIFNPHFNLAAHA